MAERLGGRGRGRGDGEVGGGGGGRGLGCGEMAAAAAAAAAEVVAVVVVVMVVVVAVLLLLNLVLEQVPASFRRSSLGRRQLCPSRWQGELLLMQCGHNWQRLMANVRLLQEDGMRAC